MFLPYLLHIPLIILLIILFKKKRKSDPLLKFYEWSIGLKLIAGLAVGMLYAYFYNEGDSLLLQKYSAVLTNLLFTDPTEFFNILFFNKLSEGSRQLLFYYDEPRAFFYLKILSLLNLISFSNYWINGIYLSLFSFIGSWIAANTIVKIYKVSLPAAAFSFLFFPSFVFWTSGVLKESFAVGALFLVIAFSLRSIHELKITIVQTLVLLILLYVCWKLKFYYVLVAVPTLLTYFLVLLLEEHYPRIKKPLLTVCTFSSVFSLLAIGAVIVIPTLSFKYIGEIIFHSYQVIYEYSLEAGKLAYQLEDMGPEIFKIIKNSPEALWAGLARPYLWEIPNNLALLMGLENFFILILCSGKAFRIAQTPGKINATLVALLVYILLSATLVALIAPNWGTLSRYKAVFLPFWILFLTVNNPIFEYLEKTGDLLIKTKWKKHV